MSGKQALRIGSVRLSERKRERRDQGARGGHKCHKTASIPAWLVSAASTESSKVIRFWGGRFVGPSAASRMCFTHKFAFDLDPALKRHTFSPFSSDSWNISDVGEGPTRKQVQPGRE